MQFDQLGNLFEGGLNNQLGAVFNGVYKGYGSIDDMQNITADMFRKQMHINADGLSEFTMAQIQAKAASLGLTDSLTAQVVAMASDADFSAKAATGKLTWKKAISDSKIGVDDLIDSLLKLDNIDENSLNKLKDISKLDITDDKKKIAIQSLVDSIDGLGDSIVDIGSAGTTAGKSISSVFKGMAASIAPLLPLIAGVAGAFALFEGFKFLDDKFTLTFGTAQRHLSESSSAYSSTVSELSSMNSQLETSNARIDELKSKGTLSFTEEAELSKLERQNSLLETQIKIKERLAEAQGKEAAEAARESIDFKSESVMMTDENGKPILDKGYISSRGTSHLSGTAYRLGSGTSSTANSKKKPSNKTSKKQSTKKKSSSSSKSSAEKAAEDLIDWIAVLLERVAKQTERAIEAIDTAIGLVNKQSATSTAISKVQNEIAKQQQAYNAYLSKANSLGLSSDYVSKVQNGSLNIENVSNEDLKKKIEDYKKWLDFSHVIYLIAGKSP